MRVSPYGQQVVYGAQSIAYLPAASFAGEWMPDKVVSRTPEKMQRHPKNLVQLIASFKIKQPTITLVIGSKVEKIAVVEGPAYRIPSWYRELAATATQRATRNENSHALGVREKVN